MCRKDSQTKGHGQFSRFRFATLQVEGLNSQDQRTLMIASSKHNMPLTPSKPQNLAKEACSYLARTCVIGDIAISYCNAYCHHKSNGG